MTKHSESENQTVTREVMRALASTREYNSSRRPFYAVRFTRAQALRLKAGQHVEVVWAYQDTRLLTVKNVSVDGEGNPHIAFEGTERTFTELSLYHSGSIYGPEFFSD